MILVFDLDDTLYAMATYQKSGYKAVCDDLALRHGVDAAAAWQRMCDRLDQVHHEQMMEYVLAHYDLLTAKQLKHSVQVHRSHQPKLSLLQEAKACLKRFAQYPQYVVTDGHKGVQHRKVQALGLYKRMRHCYLTHRYGVRHAKPSPYCFLQICQREKVTPSEVIYIADNPHKDFVGIKPLGFHTVRIRQGMFCEVTLDTRHEAHITLSSLSELTESVLEVFRAAGRVSS